MREQPVYSVRLYKDDTRELPHLLSPTDAAAFLPLLRHVVKFLESAHLPPAGKPDQHLGASQPRSAGGRGWIDPAILEDPPGG